jgi:hypothetical protein
VHLFQVAIGNFDWLISAKDNNPARLKNVKVAIREDLNL